MFIFFLIINICLKKINKNKNSNNVIFISNYVFWNTNFGLNFKGQILKSTITDIFNRNGEDSTLINNLNLNQGLLN